MIFKQKIITMFDKFALIQAESTNGSYFNNKLAKITMDYFFRKSTGVFDFDGNYKSDFLLEGNYAIVTDDINKNPRILLYDYQTLVFFL